ncbi:RHS repeat protein [Acinetobacter nosocomialis]|uniref:RHS repeat protein n=1 Tax=Acinetobacter nosocomialis TaxID=106654 RepID=UPI001AE9F313|nr:RHS repeat protein [Acinetobacter nosocomialis]MBP1483855.1 RHS repeat protein [Acinetobacter nosocomialis]
MQFVIGFFLVVICTITNAAPINWTIATTSFPSDQSMGDTGQEKVPNGHIDLMSGQIVFDIPEVTLKGHRGLDFTLSRSYGKVNNGFRSIANWELEVPRLVMMTGASTRLQGDYNGQGICQSNGDYSNGNSSIGSPIYQTSIIDSGYKNEVISSYLELTNANYLRNLAYALQSASFSRTDNSISSSDYEYNKAQAQNIYNGIGSSSGYVAKVTEEFKTFTDNLSTRNKNNINLLASHLYFVSYGLKTYVDNNKITRVVVSYSGGTKTYNKGSYSTLQFVNEILIPSFNHEVLQSSSANIKFYNAAGVEIILKDANNQVLDMMPMIYSSSYANTLLALLQLKWDGNLSTNPSSELWAINKPDTLTPISDFYLYSNVDIRQRPISLYLPGQKNIIFYPIQNGVTGYPASTRYISQDNWIISCENGGNNFRVSAPNGVNYLFPIENRENQTGFPTVFSSQYIAGRVSLYASKVENQFGESYSMSYSRIENTNLTYQGYNNSSKLFLENVRHQLDGRDVLSTPELTLSYSKYKDGFFRGENKDEFQNISGDIVLTDIKRYVNGRYVVWKAYTYYTGDKSNYLNNDSIPGSNNTVAQVQNNQAANVYLRTVGDITGDAVVYDYGGPYRIIGNHPKSNNGITSQGYIWFYSDLMRVRFFKASSNGLINIKSVNWSYSLINAPRPGFDEAQSFKITYSNYTGINANSLQINYGYSRNKESNELTTTVTTKDMVTGLSKAYTYVMNAFDGGVAESFLHGLLKKVTIGDRQENYSWTTLSLIGQNPATANDNYTGYNYVYLVRPSSKTINHFGEYKTTYSNFDQYGNAQTIQQTGLNGGSAIQLPSTTTTYFNANAGNDAVNNGSLPWIIGLPKQKTSGNFTVQTTEYDELGAIQSQTQAGRITKYKYETLSFSTCLGNLVDFQWSTFVGCFSNYVSGDRHTGLPIEVDVGNGKQITQFAAYQNGIPTRIKLANGGQESNVVDDFGHIVRHTDADGIRSENQYDDAGRLIVETPIAGLSYTTISYDGLNILKTTQNGGNYSKAEKYNGDGLLIHSAENTTNKSVVMTNSYDAFGNITFSSNPSSNGTTTGISTDYDLFDRPKTVNNNGVTISYCYQSCAGRSGAIALVSDAYGITESNYLSAGDFRPELKTSVIRKGNDGSVFETFTDYDLALLQPVTATSGASTQRYTYNTNGLLATEKDNSINGQKTYGYDATGKINTITHQDGSVETIEYYPINDLIASRNWRGVTTSYGYTAAGRLTSTSNANTAQSYGRDSLGRVISLTQSINSHDANYSFTLRFGYNNLNQIVFINYPNGKAVDLSNQNAFAEIGSIPNVIQSLNYNALHQLIFVQANADVAWDYSYSNNGLPTGVSSTSLNKCAVSISYGYDALNRINRMVDNCGATYNASIDRYGTGLMKQVEQDHARYQYSYNNDDINTVNVTAKSQLVAPASYVYQYVNGTSRLGSVSGSSYQFSYDGMGNVTNDGIRAIDYDAYYRISKNGNESYIYNADGLRVRAVRENGITDYIYDLAGRLIYEINHRAGYSQAYVYVGDKLVATLENYPDANDGYDFINNFEAAEFGLLSLLDSYLDSDDDGLPDYLERFIGSDPNNPDTDGDGYKDGYEYKQLGAKGVLDAGIHPSEPDPDEDMAAWLPTVLDLILEDD